MRTIMLFSPLILIITLLSACSSNSSGNSSYTQNMASWEGTPIQSVMQRLGKPDAVVTEPDGTKVYTFVSKTTQPQSMPAKSNYSTMVAPGGASIGIATPIQPVSASATTLVCTTTVKVNKDNKIISAKSEGNNCVE